MHCWGAMEFVSEAKAVRQEYFSALGRKQPAMLKLTGLSAAELTEIARQIADAFYDYKYNEDDIGLIKYISSREDMFIYMNAIVQAAIKAAFSIRRLADMKGI